MEKELDPAREEPLGAGTGPDPARLPLEEVIDLSVARPLLEGALELTGIPAAILDLRGRAVLTSKWEEICGRFHRTHPVTKAACVESDTLPGRNVPPGTFLDHRCPNGLRDLSAPLVVCGRHVGNLLVGQFFYEDETVDLEGFRTRARQLGFDEEAYLDAVSRVPRWSREKLAAVMRHYGGIAQVVSAVATRTFELSGMLEERDRLVASLATSEERLQLAADAADLGIWYRDVGTGRVQGDARACAQFDVDHREGSLEEILARVHPDDVQVLREKSALVVHWPAEAGRASLEYRVLLANGEIRWLSVVVKPLYKGTGSERRVVGVLGTSQDVTARKRAEEVQLRAQKLEALGTLAGGVAHDFNNILLAIRGNVRLVQAELSEGHPARDFVREIDRAGTRAVGLVRQILAFARPRKSEKIASRLAPVAEEALRLLRATLPAEVVIGTRWDPEAPSAAVDTGQVHQAVVNLVTNAAQAIGRKPGRIDVELSARTIGAAEAVELHGILPGRYACLSVHDDGCGMDAATLARSFDPFFTTKGTGEGTGLGLSIVHGIMRAHGGTAFIRSAPGQGTAVSLFFPAEEAPVEAEREIGSQPQRTRIERLLVVDDDEAIALLSQHSLGRLGYAVTSFTDPVAAVAAFTAAPFSFDALVTDLSMPGMNGFEVTSRILSVRPDLPVVITSGYVRPEDEEAAARLGVRAVIEKANTVEEMAGALDRIFQPGTPGPSVPRTS